MKARISRPRHIRIDPHQFARHPPHRCNLAVAVLIEHMLHALDLPLYVASHELAPRRASEFNPASHPLFRLVHEHHCQIKAQVRGRVDIVREQLFEVGEGHRHVIQGDGGVHVGAQAGEGPLVDGRDVGEVGLFEGRGQCHAVDVAFVSFFFFFFFLFFVSEAFVESRMEGWRQLSRFGNLLLEDTGVRKSALMLYRKCGVED